MEQMNNTEAVVAVAVPIQPDSDDIYHGVSVTAEPIYNVAISQASYPAYPYNSNTIVPDFGILTLRQHQLVEMYKTSRLMLKLSTTHFVIIILFLFVYTFWYLFLLPMPLIAYYGYKNYSSSVLYLYVIYVVVEVIVSILSLFIYTSVLKLILRGLYIIYLICTVSYTVRLIRAYNLLDQTDIDFLKHSTIITNLNRLRTL